MRNGDAKADASAHGILAMTQGGDGLLTVGSVEMPRLDQAGDNLLQCLPTIRGRQLGNNLILGE